MPLVFLSAAASAQVLDCRPGSTSLLVGVPPFEVRCTASAPDGALRDDVTWRFGDGDVGEGATVTHVYEDVGRYLLAAEFPAAPPPGDSAATGDTGLPPGPSEEKVQVTVCGPPRPDFRVHFRGGLEYALENLTPPDPGCLAELRWDVFRGAGQGGAPIETVRTWDPVVVLPDRDTYTFVLSVGGIGGTAAAAVTVEARGGRTDAYGEAPIPWACASPGAGLPAGLGAAAALLVLSRRRR